VPSTALSDAGRLLASEPSPTDYLRRALKREPITEPWERQRVEVLEAELLAGLDRAIDDARLRQKEKLNETEREQLLEKRRSQNAPNVPPAEWIGSAYYRGELNVWPAVKDLFVEIVEGGYNVIVLRGSAGWAKTTLGRLLLLRSLHEAGNYASVHREIGPLSSAIPLRIPLVHKKVEKAREALLDPIVTLIRSAGWFRDNFQPPKRIYGPAGHETRSLAFFKPGNPAPIVTMRPTITRPDSIIGDDLLAIHLSECNSFDVVEDSKRSRDEAEKEYDVAEKIWRELRVRLLTRFHKPLAPPVRVILESSERYHGDFLDRISKDLERHAFKAIVIRRSNWDTPPGKLKGPWFDFAIPRRGERGEVVDTDERKRFLVDAGREIIRCPQGEIGEYLAEARADPEEFVRSVAGYPTDAIRPWLHDLDAIDRCAEARVKFLADAEERWKRENMRRVVRMGETPPMRELRAAAAETFLLGYSRIDWSALSHRPGYSAFDIPRVLPDAPRFIHIDLADTGEDFVGFAMGCVAGERSDGPVIWFDLILRIDKPPGAEHDIDGVRQLVEQLRDHGFTIQQVSFDRYQSSHIVQILRDRGFSVERLSVHRTDEAYKTLRAAIVSGRALFEASADLKRELAEIERKDKGTRTIVEHRKGGHDDAPDAMAGVVWQASRSIELPELDAMPAFSPEVELEPTNDPRKIPLLSPSQLERARRSEEELELEAELIAMEEEERAREDDRAAWERRTNGAH